MKKANKMYSLLMAVVLMCMAVLCVHANDIHYEVTLEYNSEPFDFEIERGGELEVMASCACHKLEQSTYEGGTCPTCNKKSKFGYVYRCKSCGEGYVLLDCGHKKGLKAD